MTVDEYFERSQEISAQLRDIAEETARMARAGTATSRNEPFCDLMRRHNSLVREQDELHRKFVDANPALDI